MKDKRMILVILLVIAGLFYWYEIRPAQIRKDCYQWAIKLSNYDFSNELMMQESCWHRYGLK
jgi:hypothetical protein